MSSTRSEGRRRNRITLVLGAATALVALPGLALAVESPTEAPPGAGHADVLAVTDQVKVGHTSAEGTAAEGSAEAHVVGLQGDAPLTELGGEQRGDGASSGHLLDVGDGAPVDAALTPWEASSGTEADGCRTSDGSAAVARVAVDQLATADVLESRSASRYCSTSSGTTSSGEATSNGAVVTAADGAVRADVLHSGQDESGEGTAHAASIGGQRLLSSDDVEGRCTVEVPDALVLGCFSASGGDGGAGGVDTVESRMAGVATGGQSVDIGATRASDAATGGRSTGAVGGRGGELGAGGSGGASSTGTGVSQDRDTAGRAGDGAALAATGGSDIRALATASALVALGLAILSLRRLVALAPSVPTAR